MQAVVCTAKVSPVIRANRFAPVGRAEQPEVFVQGLAVAGQVGDCAVVGQAAFVDKQHAIGHGLNFLQDVGGEQDGLALAQLADGLADLVNLVGVQAGGRLVEDQHVRLVQQHLGHAHPLAITARQLADGLADDAAQGAKFNHRLDPLALPRGRQAAGVGKELEQAAGRHVGIQRAVFRQVAEFRRAGQAVGGHVVSGDPCHTGGGGKIARQKLHRGALAGAVGAQKGHHFALADRKANVLNGGKTAVIFAQPLGFDHGRAGWLGHCKSLRSADWGRPE